MTGDKLRQVYVSAGSNIAPEKNLRLACRELEKAFGPLSRSSVYRTKAIGFDGGDFLNMVMRFSTRVGLERILAELEAMQILSGRPADASPFASRTLDLDLLLYGARIQDSSAIKLPRDDITKYAFVLGPMAELAPDLRLPGSGKTMRELWAKFDRSGQPIQRLQGFSVD
jgi:2-amino-4-hydroxy-6-hydroxymethyldihydropteridine diphosphokinase